MKGYRTLWDEPACRVCGCTEHNACADGCAWVKVENDSPPLCSACSGTTADMVEAVKRGTKMLSTSGMPRRMIDHAVIIGRAALRRRNARAKIEARNPDPAWGSR